MKYAKRLVILTITLILISCERNTGSETESALCDAWKQYLVKPSRNDTELTSSNLWSMIQLFEDVCNDTL